MIKGRFLKIYLAVLGIGLLSCGGSKTDFVQSPQEQPSSLTVQMRRADYNPVSGGVQLEWLVAGQGDVGGFRILKGYQQDNFSELARLDAASSGKQNVFSFLDKNIFAGESQYYKVEVESKTGVKTSSNTLMTQLPGARLNDISAKEIEANIQLSWTRENNAAAYELVRSIDNGSPEIIFLTQNVTQTAFIDKSLTGNLSYTYVLNTLMPDGTRLKSQAISTGFYRQSIISQIGVVPENFVRLCLDWTKLNAPMALVFGLKNMGITQFDMQYTPGFVTRPPIYKFNISGYLDLTDHLKTLNPTSVSFDGPSIQQRVPKLFVSGIEMQTNQVKLYAFEKTSNQNIVRVEWNPTLWDASQGDGQTAISYGGVERLFVCAAGKLRMFDRFLNAKGDLELPFAQTPYDILGLTQTLWASFPQEGRLLRGDLQFDSSENLIDILWQDVSLPNNARPLGLDVNSKYQVIVLDASNAQLIVYSPDGKIITQVVNIGKESDFRHVSGGLQGDLSASLVSSEGAYVINAQSTIKYFGDSTAY